MSGKNLGAVAVMCGIVLSLSAGLTMAAPVLDQESPVIDEFEFWLYAGSSNVTCQQGVTVGVTGLLTRVELYAVNAGTTPLTINAGAPWQSDASDFATVFVAAGEGWTGVDVSAAGLFFNAGDQFVIGVGGTDSGLWLVGSDVLPDGAYAAGELWLRQIGDAPIPTSGGADDLAFRTYVDSQSSPTVPAPAGVLLGTLGTGLVGWLRRRRSL